MSYKEQIKDKVWEHLSRSGVTFSNTRSDRWGWQRGDLARKITNSVLSLLTEDKCPNPECKDGKVPRRTGWDDKNWMQSDCPTCHGTGKPVKKCPECKGDGYDHNYPVLDDGKTRAKLCPKCKGEGWLPDDGLLTEPDDFNREQAIKEAQHDKDLIRFNAQDLTEIPLHLRTVDNLKEMVRLHFESGGLLSDFLPDNYIQYIYELGDNAQDLYVLDIFRCQECPAHSCYFGQDGMDCSCRITTLVTPTTNEPPSDCPLKQAGILKVKPYKREG